MSWDSMSEKIRQSPTTFAMAPKKSRMKPGESAIGTKAQIVVSTPKITGTETSWVPMIAARRGASARSWCVWTFSPTTIASSTRSPSTRMKAKRVSTSIERPTLGKAARAPRKEIGIPIATHRARRSRRKSARIVNTRTKPVSPLFTRIPSRSRR
jgi:hypothetical protein